MSRRDVNITLSNNTPFTLTLVGSSGPCHGDWTAQPPQQIQSKTHGVWQSDSSGILTGTEGWVKYVIESSTPGCPQELVYIHWDNPFVWDNNTTPLDFAVSTNDITPHCDQDKGSWGTSGGFQNPPAPQNCAHELFLYSASGGGPQNITWWDVAVNWPALLALILLGQADIHLTFVIGLRAKGSTDESIFSFYDGSKGLRALANAAGQSSLRKLFHM